MSNKINLELTLEETNGLLNLLAQLPFIQAVGVINLIQSQAGPQAAKMVPPEEKKDESETAS